MVRMVLSGSNHTQNGIYCWGWTLERMEFQMAIRKDYHGTPMLAVRAAPSEEEVGTEDEPRWSYVPMSPAFTCDGTWRSFYKNVNSFMEVQRSQQKKES